MKTWKIVFYIGKQIYDIEIYEARCRPVQFAGYCRGLATHFEIEELEV